MPRYQHFNNTGCWRSTFYGSSVSVSHFVAAVGWKTNVLHDDEMVWSSLCGQVAARSARGSFEVHSRVHDICRHCENMLAEGENACLPLSYPIEYLVVPNPVYL